MFVKAYNFLKSSIQWIMLFLLVSSVLISAIYGSRTGWFNIVTAGLDRRLVVLVLVVVVIVALVVVVKAVDWLLRKRKIKIPSIYHWIFIFAISIAVLITQFIFIKQYNFYTGWDAGTIRHSAVETLEGRDPTVHWFPEYYNVYDNNRTLVSIFILVGQLADNLQIQYEEYNDVFIFTQLIIYLIASVALFAVARKLAGRFLYAWLAYALLTMLIGISPWLSIPYSDCMSIAFSILALWIFTARPRKIALKIVKYSALGLVTTLAISIKPQSAIMIIAIAIYLLMTAIKKPIRNLIDRWIEIVACLMGFFVMALSLQWCIDKINDQYMPIEKGYSMPWTHFVMMGLNKYSSGMHWVDDVYKISLQGQFKSVDGVTKRDQSNRITTGEIKQINIREIKKRLADYGPLGLLNHLKNKTVNNFNDGMFTWFWEGGFDWMVPDRRGQPGAWLRALYYYPAEKKPFAYSAYKYIDAPSHFHAFRNVERIVWWSIILLAAVAGFVWRKKDAIMIPAMLSVIGITLFELIFESRSRYFITMTPVFVLLATIAVAGIASWRKPRRQTTDE